MKYNQKEMLKTGLLFMAVIVVWSIFSIYCTKVRTQAHISDAVIRFHVIANSDSDEDQAVKYKVRDQILKAVQTSMEKAETKEEANEILVSQLSYLTQKANEVLEQEGVSYRAKAVLEQTEFPVKTYGDLTFPSGEYQAVRILLGTAQGQNWWCVMFPTLCLVDGTCEKVPEVSKKKLKASLSEKEYRSLFTKKKNGVTYEYRLRLTEWLSEILG